MTNEEVTRDDKHPPSLFAIPCPIFIIQIYFYGNSYKRKHWFAA
jgi:hypothetical protein